MYGATVLRTSKIAIAIRDRIMTLRLAIGTCKRLRGSTQRLPLTFFSNRTALKLHSHLNPGTASHLNLAVVDRAHRNHLIATAL